jgi:hypothetical protein
MQSHSDIDSCRTKMPLHLAAEQQNAFEALLGGQQRLAHSDEHAALACNAANCTMGTCIVMWGVCIRARELHMDILGERNSAIGRAVASWQCTLSKPYSSAVRNEVLLHCNQTSLTDWVCKACLAAPLEDGCKLCEHVITK